MTKQDVFEGSFYLLLACAALATDAGAGSASAQTRWCGPTIVYQQPAAGQADALSPQVAINRGFSKGIYNSVAEPGYVDGSPAGTEWAFGRAADYASLAFQPWAQAVGEMPPDMVGRDMVVHLIAENIYLDLRFTAWAEGPGTGTRFTYARSTPGACIAPNPVPAAPAWLSVLAAVCLLLLGGSLARSRTRDGGDL